MFKISTAAMLLTLAASAAFAQSAFDGTWALNQSKSKLTGDTMTFASAGPGSMTFSDSVTSYNFKTDGSNTITPMGDNVSWKQDDPNTYEHTTARAGTQLSSSKWTISSDAKTLTIDSNGTKPNGEKWQSSATYARISGNDGLAGTWKSTSVKMSAPNTMTMAAKPDDTMQWDISAEKASWKGKLDGQDYPATGPTVPEGITLAVTKLSPNSIKMVEKLKGKPLFMGTYSVASDGKTMNMEGTNGDGKEPVSEVWEKQ